MATLAAGAAVITLLFASVQTADARPRPRSSRFSANKEFGLGIMLGVPSGLSGKYFLSPDTALDFGVGVVSRWRGRDGLHLHADFLWHPVSLANTPAFALPLYFGIGARLWDWDEDVEDDLHLGARIPVGLALDFNHVPLDVFFELAFVLDIIGDVDGDLNGAIGVRYYFF